MTAPASVTTTGEPSLRTRAGAPRVALAVAAGILLILLANIFAAAYVSSERTIYGWDWSRYWMRFARLGASLRDDPGLAFSEIIASIRSQDYNLLPVVPLLPFELSFGSSRLSYILAITNAAVLPSAAMMALVVQRTAAKWSWPQFLLCTAAVAGLHVLWAPALRGLPDVLGVGIACGVLLAYFDRRPGDQRPLRLITIGILLGLLVLTRRWYLFWALSFFPAAMIASLAAASRTRLDGKEILKTVRALAIVGVVCASFLVSVAAPMIFRVGSSDYSLAYAAYRADLVQAGPLGQLIGYFGLSLLALCAGGLGWLVSQRQTREVGVFLIVQCAISFALFTQVQTLFGIQHYYLFLPAAGIGVGAAIVALWDAKWHPGWRATAIGGVVGVVLLSSIAAFEVRGVVSNPLLPRQRFAPLVRHDLSEMNRLLDRLAALKPRYVYVASSSEVMNWSILRVACLDRYPEMYRHVAVAHEIDTRDGFPRSLVAADYVVLATPTQYHARPEDQQVVGTVTRDLRERSGIGASFEPLPGVFDLGDGVEVQIYRRTAASTREQIEALSAELLRSYPTLKHLFEFPAS